MRVSIARPTDNIVISVSIMAAFSKSGNIQANANAHCMVVVWWKTETDQPSEITYIKHVLSQNYDRIQLFDIYRFEIMLTLFRVHNYWARKGYVRHKVDIKRRKSLRNRSDCANFPPSAKRQTLMTFCSPRGRCRHWFLLPRQSSTNYCKLHSPDTSWILPNRWSEKETSQQCLNIIKSSAKNMP